MISHFSFIENSNSLHVNLTMIAFFSNNSAENCRSENQKNGIDASWWDLNFSGQKFSSKMNSLTVIFEK